MTRGVHIAVWACLILGLPAPNIATADPAVAIGLNVIIGGGRMDTGVGIRVFSSDRADATAGSIGVDYLLHDQKWRATLGAAYLFDQSYLEVNGGLPLGEEDHGFDLGFGGGVAGHLGTTRTPVGAVASRLASANQ